MTLRTNRLRNLVLLSLLGLTACANIPKPRENTEEGLFARLSSPSSKSDIDEELALTGTVDGRGKADLFKGTHNASARFRWPLERVDISSHFGPRKLRRKNKYHEGVDFRANVGTPIMAVSDGKVVFAGNRLSGYGKMVVVRHDGNLYSIYAHLSKIQVKKGQSVRRGEQMGKTGRTGRTTGAHLHFEIRRGVNAVDPIAFLNQETGRTFASKGKSAAMGIVTEEDISEIE